MEPIVTSSAEARALIKQQAAMLTPSRLIAFHRLITHSDWPIFWDFLKANFVMDESVFMDPLTERFDPDPIAAAKRDGERGIMLLVRRMLEMPTPGETEETDIE